MITSTTIGGIDCLLILQDCNWSDEAATPTLGLRRETEITRGQTRRENRSPLFGSLRLRLSGTLYFDEDDLEAFRNEIAVLGNDLVALPIWPDSALYADYASRYLDAQYWITYNDDFSAYAVNTATYDNYAPLLFGRLESEVVTALTMEKGLYDIELVEDSPYTHRVSPRTVSVSSDWPTELLPNWISDPEEIHSSGQSYVRHARGGRQTEPEVPENVFRWEQSASFDFYSRADISTFLNFWDSKKGRHGAFAVPTFLQPGTATGEAPFGLQARFAKDEVELAFHNPGHCRARLKFIQLPWELSPPSGETAEQASEAWFLKISYDIPSKSSVYLTDWDQAVTYDSNDYQPFNFKVDKLDQDVGLKHIELRLVWQYASGDPIVPFVQGGLERLIRCTLYSGDPDTPAGIISRFSGTLKPVKLKGREVTPTFKAFDGALERQIPGFVYSKRCNYVLGDPLTCKIDLESIKNTGDGESADLSADGLDLYVRSLTGSLSTSVYDPAAGRWDRFAGGYLEVGTGDDYQIRYIVSSDYEAGTNRHIYVNKPIDGTKLDNAGSPATVTLYPGCGGTKWECEDAHSNYVNFGGHPYMPDELNQLQGTGGPGGGK